MRPRIAQGLLRNRDGTGTLELALALPVLVVLFAGMVDMSRVIATRIDAEQAAQRGTDLALAVRPNTTRAEYIRSQTASAAGLPTSAVTVDIYLECEGEREDDFDSSCEAGEDQARLVTVTIEREIDAIFDWTKLSRLTGVNAFAPQMTVRGQSSVRFQ